MPTDTTSTPTYNTLEELRLRKEQLADAMERDGELIGTMWNELFHKKDDSTKGEYIAALVANSVTAIDAFLLVRKLMKNYSGVRSLLTGSKKKKKKR